MDKVTSLFGFGGTVNIDVILDPTERKKFFTAKDRSNNAVKLPIYVGNDDISGVVALTLKDTKKFEHLGLKV
jgi:vacuolar protein sorting-associated protein 26